MSTAIKHPVPDRVRPSFVIFDIRALLTLMAERQSARMPKITNDGLTRSGTGCFIAVPIWQQWALKGYALCWKLLPIHSCNEFGFAFRQVNNVGRDDWSQQHTWWNLTALRVVSRGSDSEELKTRRHWEGHTPVHSRSVVWGDSLKDKFSTIRGTITIINTFIATHELSRQLMCIVKYHWRVYSSFSTHYTAVHRHHRT